MLPTRRTPRSPIMSLPTYKYHQVGLLALIGLLSCSNPPATTAASTLNPDEIPLRISLSCPGDPGCEPTGDGMLYVGVAKQDITPVVDPFTDLNGNGIWDPGEPYQDLDGTGMFEAYWIAGYGNGREAYDVHDQVW